MPVFRALKRMAALPSGEVGPVECCALRRLASICLRDDIVLRGVLLPLTTG